MTFAGLIKQPWFQGLMSLIILIAVIVSVYYLGKASGRGARETEFDRTQQALIKTAEDAVLKADTWKNKAEAAELYAERLRLEIGKDRATALKNEEKISQVYRQQNEEITKNYESAKNYATSDLSECDRCRDLCTRSNRLSTYGPEFAGTSCDPIIQCRFACNP